MAGLDAIPAPLLDVIAAKGKRRHYAANAIVVNEGDASSSLYIVLSGRLKVFATSDEGRDVVLADVGPGDYFGEISLDGGQRSASVMAAVPYCCAPRRASATIAPYSSGSSTIASASASTAVESAGTWARSTAAMPEYSSRANCRW